MFKKVIIAAIAIALLVLGYGAYLLSQKDIFGWRFNLGISKVETSEYNGMGPDLYFKYPKIFELDQDTEDKFGKSYVVGLKLKTDNRTGCDIRLGGPELDLAKSDEELEDGIVGPIREKAKDFNLIESGREKIGGRDGFKVSFSFLDPIGARVRLDQIFLKNGGDNFMIICGTGEYQYAFFKKDFQLFYDSINFDKKIINQ